MKKLLIYLLSFVAIFGCQQKKEWNYPFLFWGFATEGYPITDKILDTLESETKLRAQLILFYLQWPAEGESSLSIIPSLEAIWARDAVPCITWEPMFYKNGEKHAIRHQEILEGHYDDYLSRMAEESRSWKKPFIIRFGHEMNLSKYHWGTIAEEFGPESAEIYIKVYRYVVDFFRKQQVDNIFWAFCPNADSIPNEGWNSASKYYPGDAYVDILGMDGYNWAISPELASSRNLSWKSPWRSFESIFSPLHKELRSLAPYKPLIVFESSSVQRDGGPRKSEWIQEAIATAKKWDILGIVWFQANKEEDWRIHQDEDFSYLSIINSPPYSFQQWLLQHTQENSK